MPDFSAVKNAPDISFIDDKTMDDVRDEMVADYLTWQRTIGRDINPSKLVAMVMAAGAKRVTVTAPTYTTVDAIKISALSGSPTISYGGLEDD